MSKIFTRRFRVRYSELGADGRVSPSNYLRYLVETAYDWGAINQLGWDESEQLGIAWVIRETEMELFRPLCFNDQFDFTIWLVDWRKVRGTRGFKLSLIDTGELIAHGTQKVVSLDAASMRPVKPPDGFIEKFGLVKPLQVQLDPFTSDLQDGGDMFNYERIVEWRDLDTLYMVYNAVYVDYAELAIRDLFAKRGLISEHFIEAGKAITIRKLYIKYLSPARLGEKLEFRVIGYENSNVGQRIDLDLLRPSSSEVILKLKSIWDIE